MGSVGSSGSCGLLGVSGVSGVIGVVWVSLGSCGVIGVIGVNGVSGVNGVIVVSGVSGIGVGSCEVPGVTGAVGVTGVIGSRSQLSRCDSASGTPSVPSHLFLSAPTRRHGVGLTRTPPSHSVKQVLSADRCRFVLFLPSWNPAPSAPSRLPFPSHSVGRGVREAHGPPSRAQTCAQLPLGSAHTLLHAY